jgi:hypothetical protein
VKDKEAGNEKKEQKVLILGLDQITKFIYRLDGPLGEGNI